MRAISQYFNSITEKKKERDLKMQQSCRDKFCNFFKCKNKIINSENCVQNNNRSLLFSYKKRGGDTNDLVKNNLTAAINDSFKGKSGRLKFSQKRSKTTMNNVSDKGPTLQEATPTPKRNKSQELDQLKISALKFRLESQGKSEVLLSEEFGNFQAEKQNFPEEFMNTMKYKKQKKVESSQKQQQDNEEQGGNEDQEVNEDHQDDMLKSEMYADNNDCENPQQDEDNEEYEDMIDQTSQNYTNKCYKKLEKLTIDPSNKKFRHFQILCCVTLYVDLFFTSFMIANYKFIESKEENDFMQNELVYFVIITIQGTDILLNFFKTQMIDVNKVKDPIKLSAMYLKGMFVTDVVSTIPWILIDRRYLFLRYLKVKRLGQYQSYLDELIQDYLLNQMGSEQVKKVISALHLLILLMAVSHLFGCLWMHIGYQQLEQDKGWIYENSMAGYQETDFQSLYISSVYWVIASFSSVGYGDIKGHTKTEWLYQLVVEMIGIALYGYMIGTFQTIISGFTATDQTAEQQDLLDLWLVQIDKARPIVLSKYVYASVRQLFAFKLKYDAAIVQNSEYFPLLKPRLQKKVLDQVFKGFYEIFQDIFEGTERDFQRDILKNASFEFKPHDEPDEQLNLEIIKDFDIPRLQNAHEKPEKVFFIVSGQVHLINKYGLYEYGTLHEGSYFGDIGILLDERSSFSYFYNPNNGKPLILLAIEAKKFLKICNRHPLAKEIFVERAKKRKEMFNSYRAVTLLKYMECLVSNEFIANQKRFKNLKSKSMLRNIIDYCEQELKLDLLQEFLNQYALQRQYNKKLRNIVKQKIDVLARKKKQGYSMNALTKVLNLNFNDGKHKDKNEIYESSPALHSDKDSQDEDDRENQIDNNKKIASHKAGQQKNIISDCYIRELSKKILKKYTYEKKGENKKMLQNISKHPNFDKLKLSLQDTKNQQKQLQLQSSQKTPQFKKYSSEQTEDKKTYIHIEDQQSTEQKTQQVANQIESIEKISPPQPELLQAISKISLLQTDSIQYPNSDYQNSLGLQFSPIIKNQQQEEKINPNKDQEIEQVAKKEEEKIQEGPVREIEKKEVRWWETVKEEKNQQQYEEDQHMFDDIYHQLFENNNQDPAKTEASEPELIKVNEQQLEENINSDKRKEEINSHIEKMESSIQNLRNLDFKLDNCSSQQNRRFSTNLNKYLEKGILSSENNSFNKEGGSTSDTESAAFNMSDPPLTRLKQSLRKKQLQNTQQKQLKQILMRTASNQEVKKQHTPVPHPKLQDQDNNHKLNCSKDDECQFQREPVECKKLEMIQILSLIKKNRSHLKKLLARYYETRNKYTSKVWDSHITKKIVSQFMAPKQQTCMTHQKSWQHNHLDLIIEEYMDLKNYAEDIFYKNQLDNLADFVTGPDEHSKAMKAEVIKFMLEPREQKSLETRKWQTDLFNKNRTENIKEFYKQVQDQQQEFQKKIKKLVSNIKLNKRSTKQVKKERKSLSNEKHQKDLFEKMDSSFQDKFLNKLQIKLEKEQEGGFQQVIQEFYSNNETKLTNQ